MKNLSTLFLTGMAALSIGAAAQAQNALQNGAPADTAAPAYQHGQRAQHAEHAEHAEQRRAVTPEERAQFEARRAERFAKRSQQLHDELHITSTQENAWQSFVASMQPAARSRHGDRAEWASLSAPQRMAKRIDMQKQRTAAMEQRLGALNSFYAVLTPEQKKVFDTRAAQMQARWGGHGGHGGHDGNGGWQRGGAGAQG